jgi:hypothetical protein
VTYRRTTLAKRTLDLAESLLEAPEGVLLALATELKSESESKSVGELAACILECAARAHGRSGGFAPEPPPTKPELGGEG